MKKVISLTLSIIMLLSITTGLDFSAYALADSGTCGNNVTWMFDSSTGTLTISGVGNMKDYKQYSSPSPFEGVKSIKNIIINEGIIRIGNYAFFGCYGLTNVTIPNSVTCIGGRAFSSCSGLTSITIPNRVTSIGEYAFYWCSGLTSITIPNSVTSIGKYAFYGCRCLTSITIPDSVTSIGDCAFDLSEITSIMVDNRNAVYDSRNDCNAIIKSSTNELVLGCKNSIIPDSITNVGNYAFCGCSGLKSITIPNSITNIGNYAFHGCSGLKSITIPNSITNIGNYAFYGCSGLKSITIPNSITSISNYAFSRCTDLTSITIPNSVTYIGMYAFNTCEALKDVYYSGSELQWNKIEIAIENDYISNATFHFFFSANPEFEPCVTHIWNNGIISAYPTCVDKGQRTFTCTVCSATKKEEIAAKGHSYNDGVITTKPNCTSAGVKTYTCSACGATKTEKVSANGHSYNNGVITTQPTCTRAGVKTYTCSVCGATKTESVSATGIHTYDNGKITTQPSCIRNGVKTYTCSVCGGTKTESVSATGIHTYDNGKITTQPTCVSTGVKTYTCTVCGATKTESVSATGIHTYNNGKITTQPTCTRTGVKTYACTVCGAYKTESVPATGNHTYGNGIITTQPACTKSGVKSYTCSVCGATKTESVAALGHNYVKTTKAATCTSKGTTTYTCSRCGNSYSESISALGHNYVKSTKAATCTSKGTTTYTCSRCGNKYSESISALGHKYNSGKITKKPTCTKTGTKTFTCARCESSYTEKINSLGHNYVKTVKKAKPNKGGYVQKKCSRCGDVHYKYIEAPAQIILSDYEFEYTGKKITPKVYVCDDEFEKISKENYDIEYSNGRKKLGKYTVKVTFKGKYYSGTMKETFLIVPKKIKWDSIKTKPYSTEKISVSWKKVKNVDGYCVYRWSSKKNDYVLYKKTKDTKIEIERENKETNLVDFMIATYKKQGNKTYVSSKVGNIEWVKLSAPTFKIKQNKIKEFTMVFPYKDFYYIQWSNNSDFSVDDKDTNKNYWVKTGMYISENDDPNKKVKEIRVYGLKANQVVYVRARKGYYDKKGELVLGPWSKVKKVVTY